MSDKFSNRTKNSKQINILKESLFPSIIQLVMQHCHQQQQTETYGLNLLP